MINLHTKFEVSTFTL